MNLPSRGRLSTTWACLLSLVLLGVTSVHAANELTNGGFELPDVFGGEVVDAGPPWSNFGAPNTRFTTAAQSFSGIQSLKTFGPFDFIGSGTGATQKIPAMENSPYQAEIFAQHITSDALEGDNFGVYKIEFLDANMDLVAGLGEPAGTPLLGFNFFESDPINAATPQDTWTQLNASGFSPLGTEFAQAVLVQVQLGDGAGNFTGGAIYWDDAFVMKVPPCDLDADGDCDEFDLRMLYDEIAAGNASNADIDTWLTEAGDFNDKVYLAGDTDLDGSVLGNDFTILAANFGNTGLSGAPAENAYWDNGNFNGNGINGLFEVGGPDFTGLAANFGEVSANTVPEPGAIGLLVLGVFGLHIHGTCARRTRRSTPSSNLDIS